MDKHPNVHLKKKKTKTSIPIIIHVILKWVKINSTINTNKYYYNYLKKNKKQKKTNIAIIIQSHTEMSKEQLYNDNTN